MNDRDVGGPPPEGSLGLWSVISIIVGIVVGVSIFKVPGTIFAFSSDPWTSLGVWALGGLLALVGAFCYAELATAYPRSGGDYVYLTRAFGPWCGFLFGWAQLIVLMPASIGAMSIVFADYATLLYALPDFTGLELSSEFLYAAAAIVVLTLVNVIGVTVGKFAQNLLTGAKVLGVLGIIIAGFGWAQSSPTEWRWGEPGGHIGGGSTGSIGWGALAMIFVLYAYGGWNDTAFVAAEVRNPRRNLPLALVAGVGAIIIVYLLINTAYLTGLGFEDARKGGTPLPARVLENAWGSHGATAMSVVVMISALGAANGLIFTGARVYATLGNDYTLFSWLGFWRPGHGAPILALIVQALITVAVVVAVTTSDGQRVVNEALGAITRTVNSGLEAVDLDRRVAFTPTTGWQAEGAFDVLVSRSAPVFWMFFLATGFSLFALRTRDALRERPFRVPLYPLLPFIFCNVCVYMLYEAILYAKDQALFAVVLVLVGLPLYGLSRLVGYRALSEE